MKKHGEKSTEGETNLAPQTILWRGILMPGHEACKLYRFNEEWHLEGAAVFSYELHVCQLSYLIICDKDWRTCSARVEGWVGGRMVDIKIRVDADQCWWLNEVEVPEVRGSIDLDLNFSPSTNTIAIRRLQLPNKGTADITPAWLRFPGFSLEPLPQRYHRLEERIYRYESGGGSFVTELSVDKDGFVLDYPGIWVAEMQGG